MLRISGLRWLALGQCRRCMRQAFMAAAIAWIAAALAGWAFGRTPLMPLSLALAGALTGLWLSHLTAFAARAARAGGEPLAPRRRAALGVFARAFAFGAVVTAVPFATAFAEDCIAKGGVCVLNGTPCCAGTRCQGKFPNTSCQ